MMDDSDDGHHGDANSHSDEATKTNVKAALPKAKQKKQPSKAKTQMKEGLLEGARTAKLETQCKKEDTALAKLKLLATQLETRQRRIGREMSLMEVVYGNARKRLTDLDDARAAKRALMSETDNSEEDPTSAEEASVREKLARRRDEQSIGKAIAAAMESSRVG